MFNLESICPYTYNPPINSKRQIISTINNSRVFRKIQSEYGSFASYLKTFTKEDVIYEIGKTTNCISDELSKDLKKRGMKFVGSIVIYSYLQAIGAIYSHERDCFMYKTK